jgi:uncharacterized circularly permuted ATP-grasp superfamily protein/uncharacterized alpha-E superfamily protein
MPASDIPEVVVTSGPQPLTQDYVAIPSSPDEMIGQDGALRPHWKTFVSLLDGLGRDELRRRWELARRLIHDNGVTHNVYGDPDGLGRPWGLDLIPLLIPSDEWDRVSTGLAQRARLLDRLLGDIYGPGQMVREGLLPGELVWANPGFLRPCHSTLLPQGKWLHLYAADLVRTADGQYQVLTDRTQAPSGTGYCLENRIVLSEALSSPFQECNVHRLAQFFAWVRESMNSLVRPHHRQDARIVLLTPGPYNETYFEHSYLARYLDYSLVQGNDLTVRDANVYLKTLGGLKRVDVILRRVDDDFCDPLELYADSRLGVPGLLQAIRQGNVAVANAVGSGALQAPGFLPFLPALCRRLLGEELMIPSVPTWWCGQSAELNYVLEHLHEMVVKSAYPTRGEDPTFGPGLSRQQIAELAEKIKACPERYVAQEQVMPCTTPALVEGQLQPRRFVVRAFLAASNDSYAVMPGALTRITQSNDSMVVSMQKGGGSKDTWILSNSPVVPITLLPPTGEPIALRRGSGDLPSRVADDLFWLGRLMERAEAQVRLARGTYARIADQSGVENTHAIAVLTAAWPEGPLPSSAFPGAHFSQEFIQALLGEGETNGLRGLVARVHGLATALRNRMSADAWRILREIHQTVADFGNSGKTPPTGPTEFLDSMVMTFAAFAGLAAESVTRGQAWTFLDLGRRMERAAFVVRLLRNTLVSAGSDPALLEAVLEITDSSLTYRRRYLTHLETHAVVDLLLADETNPRSAAFQFATVAEHLAALPRDGNDPDRNQDQRLLLKLRTTTQLADLLGISEPSVGGQRDQLDSLLADTGDQIAALSDAIARLYFSHAESSRESGGQRQEQSQ